MHFDIRRGIWSPVVPAPQDAPFEALTAKTVAMMGDDYPSVVFDLHSKRVTRSAQGKRSAWIAIALKSVLLQTRGGRVSQIKLGPRRRLEFLEIAVGGDDSVRFDTDDLRKLLLKSGAWTSFRTRPFGLIPDPTATPAAIFVTATNATPQAPDPLRVIAAETAENFEGGARGALTAHYGPRFCLPKKGRMRC